MWNTLHGFQFDFEWLWQGTLQQFVDRLFRTVFMKYRRGCSLPPAIKFLFDLLDTQAKELNLTDTEVLHTWKNNR